MNSLTKHRQKQIDKITNKTIIGLIESHEDEYEPVYWGFQCQGPDGVVYIVWVNMDDEANGPGALSIEKMVKA